MKKIILILLIATFSAVSAKKEEEKISKVKSEKQESRTVLKDESKDDPGSKIKELGDSCNEAIFIERKRVINEQFYLKKQEIKDLYTAKLDYIEKTKRIPRSATVLDQVRKEFQNEIRSIKLKYATQRQDLSQQEVKKIYDLRKEYIQQKADIRKKHEETLLKSVEKLERTLEKLIEIV